MHQGVAGDADDLGGDPVNAVVELHHPRGLFQKPGDQAEVACGGAVDRGDGLSGGGVRDVRAQVGEGCGQDDGELAGGQGAVGVDEADTAVELRIAGQALSMPGMPMRISPRLLWS
ncbi:hypothetical protein ACWCOT_44050 [Nonomuraea bangladeshensis]